MANKIVFNQKEGRALIRCDSNNTIALSSLVVDSETITGVVITQVAWSGANVWSIARGSNTVLSLATNGHWNLGGSGIALTEDSTGNLTITNPAASPGILLLEVKKY